MQIKDLKKNKFPVVIFGAKSVGEALFYACQEAKIKVECFCDNDKNKKGTLVCNTKVIHTSELKKKYPQAVFLISAADIQDVVSQLTQLGYKKWLPCTSLLRNFDIYKYKYSAPIDFVEYTVGASLLCHDSYLTPKKIFMRSVDMVITERCSLRCRDCSNLMRYYRQPLNFNVDDIFKQINRFFSLVDEVNEFRVIGGEPFMNKDAHLIIKKLIKEPKVKRIVIYTNGTIPLRADQIKSIKHKKVLFIITDYGQLSRNLINLTQQLKKNKIAFYIQKAGGWTDCNKIKKQNRSLQEQKTIFKNCCVKNSITLLKGYLYRCPFSANAINLQAVPDFKNDYVNIFDKDLNIKELKKKIRSFLLDKEFLQTCDYCNGRSFGDPIIKPAIQIDKTLEYKQYQYN